MFFWRSTYVVLLYWRLLNIRGVEQSLGRWHVEARSGDTGMDATFGTSPGFTGLTPPQVCNASRAAQVGGRKCAYRKDVESLRPGTGAIEWRAPTHQNGDDAEMNWFDKICATLAFVLGIVFFIFGVVGLFTGCRFNFAISPGFGVVPAFVGWGIIRAVWFGWSAHKRSDLTLPSPPAIHRA